VDETDGDVSWKDSEEDEDVRRERARKMKAMPVKMETVTLIVKVRWNLTCLCIKCTKLS
jgi:hypothetical protein